MPLIKVNHIDGSAIDINPDHIIQFYTVKEGTRIDLRDNLTHVVSDTPRSIRGYIGRATGTLPEKQEVSSSVPSVKEVVERVTSSKPAKG